MESRVNSMRKKLADKKEQQKDANEIFENGINSVLVKLMQQLEDKVERGDIQVKDTNDIYKMLIMYGQISELTGRTAGGGAPPALNEKQKEVLSKHIETTGEVDEEGHEYIDMDKLSEMTPEELTDMVLDKEKQMNIENSKTF